MLLFVLFVCYLCCSILFLCKCVLPPGDNPIAVNKYIINTGGKTMRILYEPKSFEVPRDYRELDNEKFHDLHNVKNMITVIK